MRTPNSMLLLADRRLPAIKLMWKKLAEQADKDGWPAAKFLAALAEHEVAERSLRRIKRHLTEARIPIGKALTTFVFKMVPIVSKAQVMAVAAGDTWLEKGAVLLFGPPGAGQVASCSSHRACSRRDWTVRPVHPHQ